ITVLSVFNGFQREVRTRMLSAVAHIQVSDVSERLSDWQQIAQAAKKHPQVVAAAPYVSAQGLLTSGGNVRGAFLRGILPELEGTVDDLPGAMRRGELAAWLRVSATRAALNALRKTKREVELDGADLPDALLAEWPSAAPS
ncbi:MAG: hypothetical protein V4637_08625, partial [Pseudomonadota bacterium]